jgi:hypothetical protein
VSIIVLTNDQILQACNKRIEGCSWAEIGTSLGIHGSHVRDYIANALRFKERDSICAEQIDAIKYIGIRKFIKTHFSSIRAFISAIGYIDQYAKIATALKTGRSIDFEVVKRILDVTGMTFEEAFQKDVANAEE